MSDEEDNPIDNLILKKAESRAKKRAAVEEKAPEVGISQPAAALGSTADASGKKKKRRKKSATPTATDADPEATVLDALNAPEAADGSVSAPQQKAGPVGVIVLEDGDPEPNYEMQKLLRAPRYFDQVYEPKGVACWRCGKRGHLAKDCTLSEAKPCVYCAQYGHESRDCPHRICYRCGLPGHMTKDCTQRANTAAKRGTCMRCGRPTCAAADYLDWFRYEGGCDQDYYSSDLDMVRCFVCGEKGHLSCQPAPLTAPRASCWNCGGAHWAEECPEEYPSHLMAERLQDRDRQKQQRVQQEQWQMLQQQRQQLQQQQATMRRPQHPPQQQQRQQYQAGYQQQQQWGGQQQRYAGGQQQQWGGHTAGRPPVAGSSPGYAAGSGGFQHQGSWQQQQHQQQSQQQWGWHGQQQQQGYQQQGGWQGQQRYQGQQQNDFPRGRGSGGGGNRKAWR